MIVFNPIKEIDIYGVFMPPLLVWALVSFLMTRVANRVLAHKGFYRSDLEQQVFDTSLFVIVMGLLSFLFH